MVKRSAKQWLAYQPELDLERLSQAITQTLLDPQSFSQAGRDFRKKLNTIGKLIREGRWGIPIALEEKAIKEEQAQKILIECRLRELEGDRAHLSRMLSVLSKTEDDRVFASLERQLFECNLKINQLIQTIEQGDQP